MKAFQRIVVSLLLFTLHRCCFGIEDTNVVALGEWSQPVDCSGADRKDCGSLRGRLLIRYGYSPRYAGQLPETQVYLELQNVSTTVGNPMEIYFDPQNGLQCELRDSHDQPPPPIGTGGSGAFPSPCWVTLPYDSTVRLRSSWYGYGMPKNKGLKIPLFQELIILAENTNDYFLSSTFTVTAPTNHICPPDHCVWQGTLTLPKMKIAAKRP